MRRADRINLVSPGFEDYFRGRYGGRPSPGSPTASTTSSWRSPPRRRRAPRAGPRPCCMRATSARGRSCTRCCRGWPRAARACRFVVIGDGGRRRALEQALARSGADNVELRPPVPRAELIRSYRDADVLLLHLGRHPAFEKVLPSKLFEYAALGKPILAGVSGCARHFHQRASSTTPRCSLPATWPARSQPSSHCNSATARVRPSSPGTRVRASPPPWRTTCWRWRRPASGA